MLNVFGWLFYDEFPVPSSKRPAGCKTPRLISFIRNRLFRCLHILGFPIESVPESNL